MQLVDMNKFPFEEKTRQFICQDCLYLQPYRRLDDPKNIHYRLRCIPRDQTLANSWAVGYIAKYSYKNNNQFEAQFLSFNRSITQFVPIIVQWGFVSKLSVSAIFKDRKWFRLEADEVLSFKPKFKEGLLGNSIYQRIYSIIIFLNKRKLYEIFY